MKEILGFIKKITGFFVSLMIIGVLVKRVIDSRNKENTKPTSLKSIEKPKVDIVKIQQKTLSIKGLSKRQQEILKLFENKTKVYMDDITLRIKGVHVRTIRRELTKLTELGYIKKLGSTKGSYYMKK